MMHKVVLLFAFLVFPLILTNSYALPFDELNSFDDFQNQIIFDSNIVDFDSNFFIENNFKRYLIFGSNSLLDNNLHDNSLYAIKSDHGFFSVSVLSPESASNLVSQGYTVIEDSQLDFHLSEKIIPDASRIGEITGSSIAMQQYNASGNDIIIAIVDTGVDFSNPDIQHSLARDELNYPMMLDPDGQGIILTNATFTAFINEYGELRNYEKEIPSI